jgi:hypothetical protein
MRALPLLLALTFAQVQVPAPETEAPRTLTVTYSDGRTAPRILTARGASWSPFFPHRSDAPTHEGLALSGLKVEHRVEPDVVVVTVSLAYGQPVKHTVEVTTVRLQDRQVVQVRELTAFGVDPITLSLDAAAPTFVVVPKTASVSAMLEVSVDLLANDLPLYEITFHNRSTKAIAAIAYRTYRGEIPVLSGTRSHNRSFPILEAGGRLQFKTQAARHEGPQGFDRFEVTAVLWEDGTLEGDASLKANEHALAIGRSYQLRRVLALLRENRATNAAEILSAVEDLPVKLSASEAAALVAPDGADVSLSSVEAGQSYVRTAVLDDLKAYLQSQSANAHVPASMWVQDALVRYSDWLGRVTRRCSASCETGR